MTELAASKPCLLLMHGINLNALGRRNCAHYGRLCLPDLENLTRQEAAKLGFDVLCYQSNHEGTLVDTLQATTVLCAGIIINPGAFTHYSYGLHDALLDTQLPVVEVHLSDLSTREPWRRHSVITPACIHVISGKKEAGYLEAVRFLVGYLKQKKPQ
jgi:3-dehydroquinate dehydratase-2